MKSNYRAPNEKKIAFFKARDICCPTEVLQPDNAGIVKELFVCLVGHMYGRCRWCMFVEKTPFTRNPPGEVPICPQF
jgi:hypothetical protein